MKEISKQLISHYLANSKYEILDNDTKPLIGELAMFVQKKGIAELFGLSNPITFIDISTKYCKSKKKNISEKKRGEIDIHIKNWLKENNLPEDHPYEIDFIDINIINNEKEVNHFKNI